MKVKRTVFIETAAQYKFLESISEYISYETFNALKGNLRNSSANTYY